MGATCHKAGSTLTPGQQATVNLYATVNTIAASNKAVVDTTINLNKAGTLGDDVARSILEYCQKVSAADRAALTVLDSAQTPEQKTAAVFAALRSLDLPEPIKQFVNSNPAAQTVAGLVRTIVSIQQLIATALATPAHLVTVTKGA